MNDKPTKKVSKRFSNINFPNNNPKTPIGRNAMVRDRNKLAVPKRHNIYKILSIV